MTYPPAPACSSRSEKKAFRVLASKFIMPVFRFTPLPFPILQFFFPDKYCTCMYASSFKDFIFCLALKSAAVQSVPSLSLLTLKVYLSLMCHSLEGTCRSYFNHGCRWVRALLCYAWCVCRVLKEERLNPWFEWFHHSLCNWEMRWSVFSIVHP